MPHQKRNCIEIFNQLRLASCLKSVFEILQQNIFKHALRIEGKRTNKQIEQLSANLKK